MGADGNKLGVSVNRYGDTRSSAHEHLRPSLATGQVHAHEYDRPAYQLLDPEYLAKEDDARCDPRNGDQVLVDQDPVGSDARDARVPG